MAPLCLWMPQIHILSCECWLYPPKCDAWWIKRQLTFSWFYFPRHCSLMSPSFSPPVRTRQQLKYIAGRNSIKVPRAVQSVCHPQLAPGGKDMWTSVSLPIPPLPPSHLKHCNIIVIDYVLMVRLAGVWGWWEPWCRVGVKLGVDWHILVVAPKSGVCICSSFWVLHDSLLLKNRCRHKIAV